MSLGQEGQPPQSELHDLSALDLHCEDCGRTKRIQRGQLVAFASAGVWSLRGLHNRFYCAVCRERGGLGKNINLYPKPRNQQ